MESIYKKITDIEYTEVPRLKTNIKELDYLFGGGIAEGEALLLAGEPGSGKSTLLLQLSHILAHQSKKILYAAGEESLSQIKGRAERVKSVNPYISLTETMALEQLVTIINEADPDLLIVDSLQMLYTNTLKQMPSTPSQMTYCLMALIDVCREKKLPMIIIGHSTKGGAVAGLQKYQHMVDTVFVMELDMNARRKLISIKNRFGPAHEGIELRMEKDGFTELKMKPTIKIFKDDGLPPMRGIVSKTEAGFLVSFNASTVTYSVAEALTFIVAVPFALFIGIVKGIFKGRG